MQRTWKGALAAILVLGTAACDDIFSRSSQDTESLAAAFLTAPLGLTDAQTSFTLSGAPGGLEGSWMPRDRGPGGGGRGGHDGPGGRGGPGGDFMGGGMDGLFLGGGFRPGFGHGRHGDPALQGNCTFNAASQRVVCEPVTRNGLTVNRSAQYRTAAGAVQQAFDSVTTDYINTQVAVSGTVTHRRGNATSQVQSSSDRTVTGLARGSTQRTVNGTSAGKETTTGTDSTGAFTAVRVAGDTTRAVVIPAATAANTRPYPTAGTVIRAMTVTVTRSGGSKTSTRREVLTYDGSATAKLVITQDGTTKNCTVPLPHGRPTCQ